MQRTTTTALILAAAYGMFLVLERVFPLRRSTRPLLERLRINLTISALAIAAAAALVQPVAKLMLRWTDGQHFGLLQLMPLPAAVQFVLAFLLLDLSFYYWHRANHRFALLWRFHNVHHIDPDLDVSTGFRFHAGEVALSTGFRVVQLGLLGAPAWAFASYELVFQLVTLFEHSNLRLPLTLERRLNRVLVTPRMHGIHHSQVRRETDSNYSVVLPWWDWLHRTLRLNVPQAQIRIGVPAYSATSDNAVGRALALPLRRQRDYWRLPDGTPIARNPEETGPDEQRLNP